MATKRKRLRVSKYWRRTWHLECPDCLSTLTVQKDAVKKAAAERWEPPRTRCRATGCKCGRMLPKTSELFLARTPRCEPTPSQDIDDQLYAREEFKQTIIGNGFILLPR